MFVGAKMLIGIVDVTVPVGVSLGVVAFSLGASVVASLIFPRTTPARESDIGLDHSAPESQG